MATQHIRLIAGLGNPGDAYEKTRHNAGFLVIDELAEAFGIRLSGRKFGAVFGKGRVEGREVMLAKPMAFMNRSGPPVQRLAHYFRMNCKDLLVVHDDIDLAYGRIKIKEKGGHGGHKGVGSIMDAFGEGDFTRLRIGVGHPGSGSEVTGHVLGRFSREESAGIERVIRRAREAAVTVMTEGVVAGMNMFNKRQIEI